MTQAKIQSYQWKKYNCAYTAYNTENNPSNLALLLIHPIGVGLSGVFWQRFIDSCQTLGCDLPIYNPDLLGCGNSDLPHIAYDPKDWAEQLKYFLENVVKKPVIVIVQGALFPVAIYLVQKKPQPELIKGLILSGPPGWNIITRAGNRNIADLIWNLFFDTIIGVGFYRYARRRQFLQSFSIKELFAKVEDVDDNWLNFLERGAENLETRHAVFSFLAGFWRKDYTKLVGEIQQPTLVLVGDKASNISKERERENPEERISSYLENLPDARGKIIPGRNVLPYESSAEFVQEVNDFVRQISSS